MPQSQAWSFSRSLHQPSQLLLPAVQGEHGTGRNVAPFVEMEWGSKAYDLMWELKGLFDPDFVLNPGVVLNRVRACSVSNTLCLTPHCLLDICGLQYSLV